MKFTDKYLVIRKRFFDDFYYEGCIAERINADNTDIKFGDQTIYMGLALLVLATEIPIRKRLGLALADSVDHIFQILDNIDRLDDEAEAFYGQSSRRDGFILRDNFKSSADPRLKGRWINLKSDGQSLEANSPSADQLFGILFGLWFVKRFSDNAVLVQRSEELADRIYQYAQRSRFMLKLPNGNPTHRGADMWWLSSLMHGLASSISGRDRFGDSRIDIVELLRGAPGGVTYIPEGVERLLRFLPLTEIALQGIASFWDSAGKEAATVLGAELDVPILPESLRLPHLSGLKIKVKSFSTHIILMAIASTNIWSQDEFENAAIASNHHFSLLWYLLAHGVKPLKVTKRDIDIMLDACPDSGPRTGLSVSTGWQTDNRWIRCTNLDDSTEPGFRYAGLDFLMLHNINELVFG
jgi:hypothetical protein